jgi:SAM-dependent methyltransferase
MIDRSEGRRLFGADPAGYDSARPGHPDRVYEVLVERCGLARGSAVLEVGPGTGHATRRLLELGADPVVAIEPNEQLADYLETTVGDGVEVLRATLEDADLPDAVFDLATAASSFHWVDEPVGLAAIHAALRPGGWIALWWTLFGEGGSPDEFIRATSRFSTASKRVPRRGSGTGRAMRSTSSRASRRSQRRASPTSRTSAPPGKRAGTQQASERSTAASRRSSASSPTAGSRSSTRSRASRSTTSEAA